MTPCSAPSANFCSTAGGRDALRRWISGRLAVRPSLCQTARPVSSMTAAKSSNSSPATWTFDMDLFPAPALLVDGAEEVGIDDVEVGFGFEIDSVALKTEGQQIVEERLPGDLAEVFAL